MKTLGFGIKSLLKNPAWAAQHVGNYEPNNPILPAKNENDRYAPNKSYTVSGADDVTNARAKKGDIDASGINLFRGNAIQGGDSIFKQQKVGDQNIFQMMNKIDETHKPLLGAQGVQLLQNTEAVTSIPEDEKLKKIGKKLNLLM